MDAEQIKTLRYHYNRATAGVWTRGIGNQSRELALGHGPLLGEIYSGADNTFIVEAHNAMPELLDALERLQAEFDVIKELASAQLREADDLRWKMKGLQK